MFVRSIRSKTKEGNVIKKIHDVSYTLVWKFVTVP